MQRIHWSVWNHPLYSRFPTSLFICGTNPACSDRLLKPCWHVREKTAGYSKPFLLVLTHSLSLQTPPPTVFCLLSLFAPRVTTQQPALSGPDWWIACDGGGSSVWPVKALAVVSQLSVPIRIRSAAVAQAGPVSVLSATAVLVQTKTFRGLSCFYSATPTARQGVTKGLNIHWFFAYFDFPLFPSYVLCFRPAESQQNSTDEADHHHSSNFWKRRRNNLGNNSATLIWDTTTNPLWICSACLSVCVSLPHRAPTTLCVRAWGG